MAEIRSFKTISEMNTLHGKLVDIEISDMKAGYNDKEVERARELLCETGIIDSSFRLSAKGLLRFHDDLDDLRVALEADEGKIVEHHDEQDSNKKDVCHKLEYSAKIMFVANDEHSVAIVPSVSNILGEFVKESTSEGKCDPRLLRLY